MTNRNHYISTTRVIMTAKHGRMVTYFKRLLAIKSFYALITWSWKIMWQTKTIIPPQPQCLWPPNLLGWWCNLVLSKLIKNRIKNHFIAITRVPMATKLSRIMTSHDGLTPIMSHNPLIAWSREIRGSLTGVGSASKRLIPSLIVFFLLLCYSLSPSRQWFWVDCRKFLKQDIKISHQESVWPRSGSFFGHTIKYFCKYLSACGTWHGSFITTSIHSILKCARNSQKLGNVLVANLLVHNR